MTDQHPAPEATPQSAEPIPSPISPAGWHFETKQIQAGHDPLAEPAHARAIPIYQASPYVFESAKQAAACFAPSDLDPVYTHLNNLTNDVVEQRTAAPEGGVRALLTSSGQAITTLALVTLGGAGDNIVASSFLYGGTTNLLTHTLPRLGIGARFVNDTGDPAAWAALAGERTVAFFRESVPNPRGGILNIEAIVAAAHELGIPLVVDNTVASPFLTRPFEWGADIVVTSATKFLGGHGSSVAGVIVDSDSFDFAAQPERFSGFNTPSEPYHGLVCARDLGVGGLLGANPAFILKVRAEGQYDLGFALAPHSVFFIAQGIGTFSLHMERHVDNALVVTTWLEGHDDVVSVRYSGLASSPYYERHHKYYPRGADSILTFDLAGRHEAGATFIDALNLFSNLANIGGVHSLAIHPATTTHSRLDDAGLTTAGISTGTVRLSVGVEHVDNILADPERGLAAARAVGADEPSIATGAWGGAL